jgi:hypothetical protein
MIPVFYQHLNDVSIFLLHEKSATTTGFDPSKSVAFAEGSGNRISTAARLLFCRNPTLAKTGHPAVPLVTLVRHRNSARLVCVDFFVFLSE